ncbi:Protein of unknown function [Pyronema omphalodes CBS 100304]|uniref:Uncharacterized protein n=1 Tax=Pyronema omphalodes (strain CBS 100304) TaxID=1076935 RepID=U4LHE8_PYROM|nr:Protein of unknown function [Pyronema omphalodes CBS 100304]
MDKIKSAPKAIATKVEEMFEDVKSASKAVATEAAKKVENGKKKAEEIKSNIPMPGGDNDTEKDKASAASNSNSMRTYNLPYIVAIAGAVCGALLLG